MKVVEENFRQFLQTVLCLSRKQMRILPQNALKRDCNGKSIEWIEGHYLEVVVPLYIDEDFAIN